MGRVQDYLGFPRLYSAAFRLQGAANPTSLSVGINTLGGEVVWTYTAIGFLTGTCAGAPFPAIPAKMMFGYSYTGAGTNAPPFVNLRRIGSTTVSCDTRDLAFASADFTMGATERLLIYIAVFE
jgi:hypothetical protein